MIHTHHYKSPNPKNWKHSKRNEEASNSRIFEWIKCQNISDIEPTNHPNHWAILGFCSDEGVHRNKGRRGAEFGPEVLRTQFKSYPLQYSDRLEITDFGDIICLNQNLENSQNALAEAVFILKQNNFQPIVLGGGHETAWGHFQGLHRAHPDSKIGIINFDAHFDLRPVTNNQGHSGTPFLQIHDLLKNYQQPFSYLCLGIQKSANTQQLFETAETTGTEFIYAKDMNNTDTVINKVQEFSQNCDSIYLSVCLDVFGATYTPGVSAPQPFGIDPKQFIPVFEYITKNIPVVGWDIVELAPTLDKDQLTAKFATAILGMGLDQLNRK